MRLATSAPVKCSGCFCAKPDLEHVDFESAFDGPLLDPDSPRRGHVDWLILCAECIRSAAGFLPEVADDRDQLRAQVVQLTERAEQAEAYADRLEDTLQHRPDARRDREPRNRAERRALTRSAA